MGNTLAQLAKTFARAGVSQYASAEFIEALADRIEELEAENHLLKTSGIAEVAARNPSVMEYMQHWEGRAESAEAKLAKAVAEMKSLTDASTLMQSSASYDRFKHNSIVTESIWSQWSKQLKFARTAIKELTGDKDG